MLALDIGGAHLKGYHRDGRTLHERFEVWRRPHELADALQHCFTKLSPFERVAVTTTAELCDCFETRRDGVLAILDAAERALEAVQPEAQLLVWTLEGQLVPPDVARRTPELVAAANWYALACNTARRFADGLAVLIDMGSTTVDLIPLRDGSPCPRERTDSGRLVSGELVYTGFRRTPTFAVRSTVTYRDHSCPVVPELFATMEDAYVVLGQLAEDPEDRNTADGRERTCRRAIERLGRTVGADRESFDSQDATLMARELTAAQVELIVSGLRKIDSNLGEAPHTAIVCGEGEGIVREAVDQVWPGIETASLSAEIGAQASSAACAYSLVELMALEL